MSKTTKWLLGILIVLIFIGFSFFIGYYLPKKASEKAAKTNPPALTTSGTSPTSTSTTNSAEQAQNGAGWFIFKNLGHSYLIEYPQGAEITNTSGSESEAGKDANQSSCVQIKTKYVSVVISARDNQDSIECLRTGFGSDWSSATSEEITIAGQSYTVTGMKTESASAGNYEDSYGIQALSGEGFNYGISVNEKYDEAMTKIQAKAMVHKILASFSPAE